MKNRFSRVTGFVTCVIRPELMLFIAITISNNWRLCRLLLKGKLHDVGLNVDSFDSRWLRDQIAFSIDDARFPVTHNVINCQTYETEKFDFDT